MADGAGPAEPRPAAYGRRSARPIALYLLVLALLALVPAFLFSAVLLMRNNEAQQRVVETLISGNTRSIVSAVDREIVANINTLKVLSTMPELLSGDGAAFHERVSEALAGTGAYVFVVDDDFTSGLTTRVPMSEQQRTPIADLDTARRAFETRDVAVSDAVLGRVSQRWVINIMLPVFPDSRSPLVVAFSRDAGQLSAALLSNRMPDGWRVAMVGRDGVIIAASEGAGSPGETLSIGAPEDRTTAEGWKTVSRDGETFIYVAQQSFLTGWTLVAWAPEGVVTRPLADAFWTLIAGGVLIAAVVVLGIYWVSLRIGRSVRGLAADAKRLGSGQPVEARHFPIAEIETVSSALGDASRRRQAAETEVRFLMRELAHRSKNQMTVIAAMAKQTARGADSVPDFVSSFEKRIFGLARSTDLLLAHGVAGVDLKELLTGQIDPFCPVDGSRAIVDGPPLRLNAQAGQIVGMAAHELATNAVKYGAFANERGKLGVTWTRAGDQVVLVWRETGFVPGKETTRRGFGTTVLETMVGRSLGADVVRKVLDDGLEWRMSIPLSSLDPSNTLNGRGEAEAAEK